MSHWKVYEPINEVVGFNEHGAGPHIGPISVTANCSPDPAYPECRIAVNVGSLASAALTLEQSAQLRAILEGAERDVRSGGMPIRVATEPARCESCSQPIRPGDAVVDDEIEGVVVHAGPCPEERGDG